MQMSNAERLITIMLADLMESVGAESELDPAFIRKMAFQRDEWALEWKYSGIFGDEEGAGDSVVNETATIMSMMSYLEFSVRELPEAERAEFENESRLQFRGFDGNHDPHFHIANTLIRDLDRFDEFKGRDLNSHGSATPATYRRLKPAYDAAQRGFYGRGFPAETLREILACYDRNEAVDLD